MADRDLSLGHTVQRCKFFTKDPELSTLLCTAGSEVQVSLLNFKVVNFDCVPFVSLSERCSYASRGKLSRRKRYVAANLITTYASQILDLLGLSKFKGRQCPPDKNVPVLHTRVVKIDAWLYETVKPRRNFNLYTHRDDRECRGTIDTLQNAIFRYILWVPRVVIQASVCLTSV